MKKFLAGIAILLLLSGCGSTLTIDIPLATEDLDTKAVVLFSGQYMPHAAPEGMELVAQKGFAAMFANLETGHFAIEDMRTGALYYSTPPDADADGTAFGTEKEALQSEILVTDIVESDGLVETKSSYGDSLLKGGIVVNKTENGIQVLYKFMEEKYAIPVEYLLCEDGFRARVLCDKIVEQGTERIYQISVLPFFGAKTVADKDGFLLVPDGSGAVMRFNAQRTEFPSYTARLYGNDYLTVEDYSGNRQENCLLPFIGLQGQNNGFLAVADNGAAYASVYAERAGKATDYNHIYFSFHTRSQQISRIGNPEAFTTKTVYVYEQEPIAIGTISTRYYLFEAGPAEGLGKMAEIAGNIVRRLSGESSGKAEETGLYLSILGGYRSKKSVLGFRVNTTEVMTSLSDVPLMKNELEKAGVDSFALVFHGLETNELRGKIGRTFQIDGAIGNQKQWQELAKQFSGRLYLNTNGVTFFESGNGIKTEHAAIRDLSLNKYRLVSYKRNTWHPDDDQPERFLLTPRLASGYLLSMADSVSATGAGLCMEDYGQMLYGDFSENGIRRGQTAGLVQETVKQISQKLPVLAKNANYDAALYADVLLDTPAYSSEYDVLDESVPFYQMVMSGMKQVVSRPLNTYGSFQKEFLQCIKCGIIRQCELVYRNMEQLKESGLDSFYAADFSYWKGQVAEKYQEYHTLYEKIKGQQITGFRQLEEGVSQTDYENGISVLVNQTEQTYQADKTEVPPMAYVFIGM